MSSRHRDEDRDYKRPRTEDRRDRDRRDSDRDRRDDRGRRDHDDRERRGGGDRDRGDRERGRNGDYYERRERDRERERERERERARDPRFDPRRRNEPTMRPSPAKEAEAPSAAAQHEAAQEAARQQEKKQAEEQEYKKRVEEQVQELEMNEEEREQRLIEERRRRRAEIAAKFKQQQQQQPEATAQSKVGPPSAAESALASAAPPLGSAAHAHPNGNAAVEPQSEPSSAPTAIAPGDKADAEGAAEAMQTDGGDEAAAAEESEEESAAPPLIAREGSNAGLTEEQRAKENELRRYLLDHRRRMEGGEEKEGAPAAPAAAAAAVPKEASEGEAAKGGDGDGFDMFNDEVEAPEGLAEDAVDEAAMMDRGDNYDDKEGYYAHRIGDVLNDRFKVISSAGKGVFSTVVRCVDLKAAHGEATEVCVKVQRNNEMMRRAGDKEIAYLTTLTEGDTENRRHCIRYLGRFDHEDHLCMIFEAMHQNLRQALKQHGHKRGIQVDAVRAYARQLFTALRYMERLNIVHADLKPDNILVNDKYNMLKARSPRSPLSASRACCLSPALTVPPHGASTCLSSVCQRGVSLSAAMAPVCPSARPL